MTDDRTAQSPATEGEEATAQEAVASAPETPETETAETADTDAADAPEREPVEADLDELLGKAQERDEYLALAQRTQADFENYRRRMTRDIGAAEGRGVARAAKELLPALDNLERALAAANEHPDDGLAEGVRLLHAEMSAAMSRLGIESFRPDGEVFDPEQHEAMATQPGNGAQPGTVLEVYQSGYRLGDTVIRPARVVVAG